MNELISKELSNSIKTNYEKVSEQLEKIKSIEQEDYKISASFRYNPTNSYSAICISECSSITELIHVLAFLQAKTHHYQGAANELGLKEFPIFKWMGYTVEDWQHDIQLRIQFLEYHKKKSKLEKWKSKLEDFLSEEDRVNAMMIELQEDFGF